MHQAQRIPTLVAFILLIIGIGGGVFLVENMPSLLTFAQASQKPEHISIANVSDTSFTVNWVSPTKAPGFVRFKKQSLLGTSGTAIDIRDTTGIALPRYVHSVIVENLEPQSTYEFEIVSNNKTYKETGFMVHTGPQLAAPVHIQDPAFGKLITGTDEPVKEGFVLASFEGSQQLSTIVSDGEWVLPLGSIRSTDGSRYFIPKKTDEESLTFITAEDQAQVTTTIDNDSPLPLTQLGASYNFKDASYSRGLIIAQAQTNAQQSGSVGSTSSFAITSPEKNAGIPSRRPTFKGIGVAGKSVIITISGNNQSPVTGKTTVTKQNTWSFTPESLLLPGEYQVTIASFSQTDAPLVTSQEFTIFKSGSQVLQAATPAASLRPSPSPSLRPSPTASASAVASASAKPTIPVSGSGGPTVTLATIAGLLLIAGFFGLKARLQ